MDNILKIMRLKYELMGLNFPDSTLKKILELHNEFESLGFHGFMMLLPDVVLKLRRDEPSNPNLTLR